MGKSETYAKFAKAFQDRWGSEPGEDKVSGLSYDAANIVFSTLARSPNSMTNAINNTGSFQGVYGEIKFRRGVNVNSKIVTVQKGKFETLNGCPEPAAPEKKSKK